MSLDMGGFIDDDFESAIGTRYIQSGARDAKGRWVSGTEESTTHSINIQPASNTDIMNLGAGGERIQDFRKVYINDGDLHSLTPQDEWEFDACDIQGVRFTVYSMDNRPWRNYCKVIVARNDR